MNKDIIVVLSETGIQISIIFFFIIHFNYFVTFTTQCGVCVCIYIYIYKRILHVLYTRAHRYVRIVFITI